MLTLKRVLWVVFGLPDLVGAIIGIENETRVGFQLFVPAWARCLGLWVLAAFSPERWWRFW